MRLSRSEGSDDVRCKRTVVRQFALYMLGVYAATVLYRGLRAVGHNRPTTAAGFLLPYGMPGTAQFVAFVAVLYLGLRGER